MKEVTCDVIIHDVIFALGIMSVKAYIEQNSIIDRWIDFFLGNIHQYMLCIYSFLTYRSKLVESLIDIDIDNNRIKIYVVRKLLTLQ